MMNTPIYPQPANRYVGYGLNSAEFYNSGYTDDMIRDYFKLAISQDKTDPEKPVYIYEDFDPSNTDHSEAIFDRDFALYCKVNDVYGEKYEVYFIDSFIKKWNPRYEAIKSPKYKEFIRSFIEFLNIKKDGNIQKSEPLRKYLIQKGLIKDVDPQVFNSVIINKILPQKAAKIVWISSKPNALYFFDLKYIYVPEANKCFTHVDGKPFHHNDRPKRNATKQPELFKDIPEV